MAVGGPVSFVGFGARSGDAGLTISRGNGKSPGWWAGIASAVVDPDGAFVGPAGGGGLYRFAAFSKAGLFSRTFWGSIGQRHDLENRRVWRKQDSAQLAILEHRPTGSRIRCLGSDPRRAHGLRPKLALLDEPSAVAAEHFGERCSERSVQRFGENAR